MWRPLSLFTSAAAQDVFKAFVVCVISHPSLLSLLCDSLTFLIAFRFLTDLIPGRNDSYLAAFVVMSPQFCADLHQKLCCEQDHFSH